MNSINRSEGGAPACIANTAPTCNDNEGKASKIQQVKTISFSDHIAAFIELIKSIPYKLNSFKDKILTWIKDIYSKFTEIFKNVFDRPLIDPRQPELITKLQKLASDVEGIKEKISKLSTFFLNGSSFTDNVRTLDSIYSQLKATLNQLEVISQEINSYKAENSLGKDIESLKKTYQSLRYQFERECHQKQSAVVKGFLSACNPSSNDATPKVDKKELIQIAQIIKNLFYLDPAVASNQEFLDKLEKIEKEDKSPNSQEVTVFPKRPSVFPFGDIEFDIDSDDEVMHVAKPTIFTNRTSIVRPTVTGVENLTTDWLPRLNNYSNSCFFHSALQALYCLKVMREQTEKPLVLYGNKDASETVKQKQLKARGDVQNTLLKLWNQGKSNIDVNRIVRELRETVFNSGLNFEFRPQTIREQLDAATTVEFFVKEVSQLSIAVQRVSTTPALPNVRFSLREELNTLQLSLPKVLGPHTSPRGKDEGVRLQTLIDSFSKLEYLEGKNLRAIDGVKIDPSVDITVKQEEISPIPIELSAKAHATNQALPIEQRLIRVKNYHSKFELLSLPDIIPIHLKRFDITQDGYESRASKLDTPVVLPEDGIVDLGGILSPSVERSVSTKYRIVSMVIHGGSIRGGHYWTTRVSEEEAGTKYVHCDDMSGNKEITKEQFLGEKHAYVIMLQRIPV